MHAHEKPQQKITCDKFYQNNRMRKTKRCELTSQFKCLKIYSKQRSWKSNNAMCGCFSPQEGAAITGESSCAKPSDVPDGFWIRIRKLYFSPFWKPVASKWHVLPSTRPTCMKSSVSPVAISTRYPSTGILAVSLAGCHANEIRSFSMFVTSRFSGLNGGTTQD